MVKRKFNEFETTKLFYNEYLYKLAIANPLACIFRDKNLTYAREQLDILQSEYELSSKLVFNVPLQRVKLTVEEFVTAKFILAELTNQSNYKLRIAGQYNGISIYSNDKTWINYLLSKPLNILEFWSPNESNLNLLVKNNIIVKNINFGYSHKITLKDKVDQKFYNWLIANSDKVKIGDTCLKSIKNGHYVRGFYFFLKNEKILSLINLMICNDIARIDNIVYPVVKDK